VRSIPQLGVIAVAPRAGSDASLHALAQRLRARAGVARVSVERRFSLRYVPNDPALSAPEASAGTPAGTPLAWWVSRVGLPAAWDVARGDGAVVAVIDTGVDGGHPDLAGKIADTIDNDGIGTHGGPTTDENGHGTHVASLACAAGDNGYGVVGAGLNCKLLVIKSDLSDGSVARSIVQAADRGADAINMSFGTDGQIRPAQTIVDAIDYAVSKDVVLVAAAADNPTEEQGDPANILQPTGTGADITAGRGLTVTAANFAGARASFAGRGSQISLAAPGSFADSTGPPGLFAAFPSNQTELEGGGGLLFPTPGWRRRIYASCVSPSPAAGLTLTRPICGTCAPSRRTPSCASTAAASRAPAGELACGRSSVTSRRPVRSGAAEAGGASAATSASASASTARRGRERDTGCTDARTRRMFR
jgi:subtilisin family serine protease